jgi:hypothetical protein
MSLRTRERSADIQYPSDPTDPNWLEGAPDFSATSRRRYSSHNASNERESRLPSMSKITETMRA